MIFLTSSTYCLPPATEPAPELVETQPEEPLTPESVSRWNAYYDRYVVLSVLLLVFIVSSNRITHSSIWADLPLPQM